jgi:hypothetical protein
MKTFFTLFATLFISMAALAAAKPGSMLTIRSADNTDIRIVLDGKRFESNDNSMMIRGIAEGYHTIRIYRQKRNGIFHLPGNSYELVYNSRIHVKRRTHLALTVERNGRIQMQESRLKRDWNKGWNDDRDGRHYDFDRDGKWGDYDYNDAHARAMSDRDFKAVLASIEKEWLESNKLKSASQIVASNYLSTAQVEQLILLFSFENNKLDLAKKAYANTIDKRNYHRLYDLFSFSSSKAELERFVERQR